MEVDLPILILDSGTRTKFEYMPSTVEIEATRAPTYAEIILWRLGGFRFLARSRAKNLISFLDGVIFDIPQSPAGFRRVRISLTPNCTHKLEFFRGSSVESTPELTQERVDVDMLEAVFERVTGIGIRA